MMGERLAFLGSDTAGHNMLEEEDHLCMKVLHKMVLPLGMAQPCNNTDYSF